MADIGKLEYIAAQLHSKSGSFSSAAETLRQQATQLDWAAQDLTNGTSSWAGQGSQAFQNAWNHFHRDTHNAATALDNTTRTLTKLAQKIDEQVQGMRDAQARATAALLAAGGLALLSAVQLGADPVTDAATAGALGLEAAAEAEVATAELTIFIFDSEIGAELEGISSGIAGSSELVDILAGGPGVQKVLDNPDTTLTISGTGPEYDASYSGSIWSKEATQNLGTFQGAPVTNTATVGAGNGNIGVTADMTGIAVEGGLSVFKAADDLRVGSDNLGVTGGGDIEALGLDGNAGFKNGTLGADVGATLISGTANAGINIAGVNADVNATLGIKAELGFQIGEQTEIKLPFISFGFSLGKAN